MWLLDGLTANGPRHLDLDLVAEPGCAAQLQLVAAPEPARAIPAGRPAVRAHAPGVIGGADDLGAWAFVGRGGGSSAHRGGRGCPDRSGPGRAGGGRRAGRWTGTACRPVARRCGAPRHPSPGSPRRPTAAARPAARTGVTRPG